MTTEHWVSQVKALMERHDSTLASLGGRIRGLRVATVESLPARLKSLEEEMEKMDSRFANERQQLLGMQNDPLVLVRSYGPYVSTYHSERAPCGRVRDRRNFEAMLLGRAKARNLYPCTACGFDL
jgi:hypothetical protein